MVTSRKTKKITLDPYVLVMFVERVFAEPERSHDIDDEDENSGNEGEPSRQDMK